MLLAPFGIVGFETAFPLLYTKFVLTGKWTLGFLLAADDSRAGAMFSGLLNGRIEVGAPADITIIDLEQRTSS